MLFVSSESQLLLHALHEGMGDGDDGRVEMEFNEFDGLAGRLKMDKLTFSLTICHPVVMSCIDRCKQKYSFADLSIDNQSLKLSCNLKTASTKAFDHFLEEHAIVISKLRRNIVAASLEMAMDNQNDGRQTAKQKIVLNNKTREALWVFGKEDRVIVTLALVIDDPTERTFAETFLKELVDTRSLPDYQSAPSVSVSESFPPELAGEDLIANAVFITFGILSYIYMVIYL